MGFSFLARDNKDIQFYTVDNNPKHIDLAKQIVEKHCGSIPENVHFIESDGDKFLESFNFLELSFFVVMKVLRSIKSAKQRHRDCRVVRRKGRLYVINKTDSRFKARQG